MGVHVNRLTYRIFQNAQRSCRCRPEGTKAIETLPASHEVKLKQKLPDQKPASDDSLRLNAPNRNRIRSFSRQSSYAFRGNENKADQRAQSIVPKRWMRRDRPRALHMDAFGVGGVVVCTHVYMEDKRKSLSIFDSQSAIRNILFRRSDGIRVALVEAGASN